MTSFQAYMHGGPSTAIVLAVGILGLFAAYGLGRTLLAIVRLRLPFAWEAALALVTGVQGLAVLSFGLSLVRGGVGKLLVPIWVASACCGAIWASCVIARRRWPMFPRKPMEAAGAFVWISAAFVCLLISLAPSTKIDELHYHMLLPSRIVADGCLRLYAGPWEASILPQMVFQFAATAAHAAGFPDAPNVLSWGLGLCVSLIVWWEVRRMQKATWMSSWAAAATWVGLYPAVWWVTGGPHAFGDLSVAGVVLVLAFRLRFLGSIGQARYVLMVSLLATAAVGAKISNAPLAATGVAFAVLFSIRQGSGNRRRVIVASALVPWLLFFLPIATWTLWKSGSPFGPFLAGWFGNSLFSPTEMSRIQADVIAANSPPVSTLLRYLLASWSPVLFLSCLALTLPALFRERSARVVIGAMLLQGAVAVLFLQPDPRFLSGIPYAGLAVTVVLLAASETRTHLVQRLRWIVPVLVIPSFGLSCLYSVQFLRPCLGLQPKEDFLLEKTAFRKDFVELDRVLPVNSALFVIGTRADNVYSPRPVVVDIRDWPCHREVFLFDATCEREPRLPDNIQTEQLVYENVDAVAAVFRTPGKGAQKVHLCVWAVQHRPCDRWSEWNRGSSTLGARRQ